MHFENVRRQSQTPTFVIFLVFAARITGILDHGTTLQSRLDAECSVPHSGGSLGFPVLDAPNRTDGYDLALPRFLLNAVREIHRRASGTYLVPQREVERKGHRLPVLGPQRRVSADCVS